MVDEIAEIGRLRLPNEACGIMLAYRVHDKQVIELPNRSDTPHDSFTMNGEDIIIEMERLFDEEIPQDILSDLTFWHTHPQGNVGPSTGDLYDKSPFGCNLVVSLGNPPLATWF